MKIYTAWELAADWWWVAKFEATPINGRQRYETLTVGPLGGVCARRLKGLRTVSRYFLPDEKFKLEKIS